MSGLEQRTKVREQALVATSSITEVSAVTSECQEADVAASKNAPAGEWSAIDGDLLDEHRAPVPAFPIDLLPEPWPAWVTGAARAADAPADYVAQAVLAAAAGVSGTRVQVRLSTSWIEPLRLWLAVVGAPSTGKSPALGMVWRLVEPLQHERIDGLPDRFRQIVVNEPTVEAVDEALNQGLHGKLLWRDDANGCFAPVKGMTNSRDFEWFDASLLSSIEPDRVAAEMQRSGDGLASRFLYAWPHPAPFCPFADRAHPDSDGVKTSLRRLLLFGTRHSCVLSLDAAGAAAFETFLARLHGEVRQAEGLEAAWLGKGRGTVARLAGLFTLMSWAHTAEAEGLREIGHEAVERAVSLWSDYYRPHARAFLQGAVPTDLECQARRVVRWLRTARHESVSKTEVRCSALGRTVDARGAERVMSRLVEVGVLQPMAVETRGQRGRPALRWHVNPLLANA
jgi:hypothetical protein